MQENSHFNTKILPVVRLYPSIVLITVKVECLLFLHAVIGDATVTSVQITDENSGFECLSILTTWWTCWLSNVLD